MRGVPKFGPRLRKLAFLRCEKFFTSSAYGSGSSGKADREEKEPEVQATAQATGAPSAKKYTEQEIEE